MKVWTRVQNFFPDVGGGGGDYEGEMFSGSGGAGRGETFWRFTMLI